MAINGEAIYATKPWSAQNDTLTSGVWYTSKYDAIYAIVLFWPKLNVLEIAAPVQFLDKSTDQIRMLETNEILKV